ncbi:MAG: hypothetical protein ACK42H_16385 [Planctomycetota bacterium]|jgi:hypothetical protein
MATKKPKETISKRREALREEHAIAVRERIQTTQLVERLQKFALGDKNVKMTPAQIKATEMLLDKSVPNLASIKHEVDSKSVTFLISTEAEEQG